MNDKRIEDGFEYLFSRITKLEGALKEAVEALEESLETSRDLRCYTHAWDWKYGECWDKEIRSIEQFIAKLKEVEG